MFAMDIKSDNVNSARQAVIQGKRSLSQSAQNLKVQECAVKIENIEIHKCDLCTRAFINPDELVKHMKLHENRFFKHLYSSYVKIRRANIYHCDSCKQTFLSKRDLLLHRVKHIQQSVRRQKSDIYVNDDIPKPYKCPDCDYKFAAKSTLEAHSIIHQPFPHICCCGIGYYKLEDLQSHMKLVQCKQKIEKMVPKITTSIKKPKIKYSFKKSEERPTVKTELNIKIKNIVRPPLDMEFKQVSVNQFECPQCYKLFSAKAAAQLHYRSVHKGERPYQCELCTNAFTQPNALKKHILSVHMQQKNFECQYCDKTFSVMDLKLRHERTHTGSKPYKCSFCGKTFSDPSAHARHQRIHTGEKRYRCQLCPKAFTDSSALYAHKKRHANKRDFKCDKCLLKFYSRSDLERHVKVVHHRQLDYKCNYCKKLFSSKGNLLHHINRIHTNSLAAHTCSICFKSLRDKGSLKNHLKVVHGTNKEYTCEYCCKQFVSKYHLNRHMLSHSQERQFECDICKARYNTKATLHGHIVSKHLAIQCKECSRYFRCTSDMKKHKLSVSEHCDICGKQFFCRGLLDSHFRTHVKKESVFECDYCKRVFTTRSKIQVHIFRYHSEPKFECDHCGQKFGLKAAIRSHMTRHLDKVRCNTCDRRFYSNIDLKRHQNKGCTVAKHTCEVCGKNLKTRNSLKVHSVLHMENRETIKCPLCKKKLSSKPSAVRHLRLVHDKKRKRNKKVPLSDDSE